MENNFKFSVLMSVYWKENPSYLKKAIESVVNQELKPNEIVLIKDGPLTEELEKAIDQVDYLGIPLNIIAFEKNMGLGEALRIGVEKCSYNLIARMDTDDISKPDRFRKQIEVLKNNQELDMVGSWTDEFEEIGGEIKVRSMRKTPENEKEILEKLKNANAFNHPTVMYKKSKVLEAGNYSEKYNCLEDYYLWVRMAVKGCKFYNIQESLIYFRITPGTSKRRGGLKMLQGDFGLHSEFLELGFINKTQFIKNMVIWGSYRLMPWKLRELMQKKIMRKKK